MNVNLKRVTSRIVSCILATVMAVPLASIADIPDNNSVIYAAETSEMGSGSYTTKPISGTKLTIGNTYTLGGYKWIAAEQCDGYVVMQAAEDVTSGAWPGYVMHGNTVYEANIDGHGNTVYEANIDGQDISSYDTKMTTLYNNIKAMEYSGAKKGLYLISKDKATGNYLTALATAAYDTCPYGHTPVTANMHVILHQYRVWLGNCNDNRGAYWCGGGESRDIQANETLSVSDFNEIGSSWQSSNCYFIAPAFNLDTSLVASNNNTLTAASFKPSTGIQATQAKTSVTEGETVDLSTVITGATYVGGDYNGKSATYKISVDDGTVSGKNWTAPTGINADKTVKLTITETKSGNNWSTTKNITVKPRAAKSIEVEGDLPAIDSGSTIDLAQYLTVTGFDVANQQDGTITSFKISGVSDNFGSVNGSKYTADTTTTAKTVNLTIVPDSSVGSVDYSKCSKTVTLEINPVADESESEGELPRLKLFHIIRRGFRH